jgi:uncharacterized protein YbjT (DUF2867 family)
MRVLVIGAGGFIGRHIVRRLVHAGHTPVCAGRDREALARRFPSLEIMRCDLTTDTAADWMRHLANVDAVVNAAGIFAETGANRFESVHTNGARELYEACATAPINNVVHISALGADEDAHSRFHLTKRAADDHVRQIAAANDFTGWTVVRPSLVIGRGGHSTALLSALASMPWPVRVGPGTWQSQPIHVDDLAEMVTRLVASDTPLSPTLHVVGPEKLTTDTLMRHLRRWLGLPLRGFIPVPMPLMRLAARLGDIMGSHFLTSENIAMFERGSLADAEPAVKASGWRPRALTTALGDTPATQADLWHARLFFAPPVLRIGLAIIWIATGLISAFVHPMTASVELVKPLGLTGWLAPASVYTGAAIDAILGVLLLANWRPAFIGALQIAVMLGYTALATIAVPAAWVDPFGPLLKNVAVLLATFVMIALETRRA